MKYKIKRKRKTFKVWYICFILIIVLILMSTSYSLWNTNLYIKGDVTLEYQEPELSVNVPSQGRDDNGIDRVTVNADMVVMWQDIYRVTAEEYEGNTITTTIKHIYMQQWGTWFNPDLNISFEIQNNTSQDYTDGMIELIEYSDNNNIFQGLSYTTSNTTITAGGSSEISISATLRGNQTVADNTYYSFAISYMVEGVRRYFYYNVILLPI